MKRTLGLITNNPDAVFQRNVINGVYEMAHAHGYEVRSYTITDQQAPDELLEGLVGLLVIANPVPDEFLRRAYERGLPISLVSHRVDGVPIPAVAPNNTQGIALLVEHLVVHCDRRKLVFIQGDMQQNDGIQRDAAFRQEVMRYNLHLPPEFMLTGRFVPSEAAQALSALIERNHDFDGIVASDYLMAMSAIDELRKRGLRVPEDVAVVGFGGGPETEAAGLTIVAADVLELGRRGVRQLIGQVEGLRIRGLTLLSAELIERTSSCHVVRI